MKTLFKVYEEENDYYFDVVSAATAEDAAKAYVAGVKECQLEGIADSRRLYEELKESGELDMPWEKSPMYETVCLPSVVTVIPMHADIHEKSISDERKYMAEAFESLWDRKRKVQVRL